MTYRMPQSVSNAVEAERARGRTDRQVEKIVGLPTGTLSQPYLVDAQDARPVRLRGVEHRVVGREEGLRLKARLRPVEGWRPANDCITDRPTAGKHFKPRIA